jgi:RNA polymerase sigma factor (TIGR02999 family)
MASIPSPAPEKQITQLLRRWRAGDRQALEELTSLVEADLRRIAGYLFKSERAGHTLQPTALVNEACMKLSGTAKIDWQNRAHFLAVAARAMRQILVDHARRHHREKRKVELIPLDEALVFTRERSPELLALDEAMNRLAVSYPRAAEVVQARFFGGLNNEEIAEALSISANTVIRDWNFARAWLRLELKNAGADETTHSGT